MQLTKKLKIVLKALRNANKRNLIKRVYSVIRVGGIRALKETIFMTAQRDEEQPNITDIEQNIYIKQQSLEEEHIDIGSNTISVIVVIPDVKYYIKDTIDSLKSQIYKNIEIVLLTPKDINNKSIDVDDSIKVFNYDKKSINEIIESIAGQYFMFLRAGNILAPNALYNFVNELNRGCAFTYSDECIWNFENSSIARHYLKPDFSEYYLLNNLYIEQSVCFNTKEIIEIGGFNKDIYEISALINEGVLKLIEHNKTGSHIEKILLLRHYHYEARYHNERLNKLHSSDKYIKELKHDLLRKKENAPLNEENTMEISNPKVSIIIPCNDENLVTELLNSLYSNISNNSIEIILVTSDTIFNLLSPKYTNKLSLIFSEIKEPFNYSKACNIGFKKSTGLITIFMQDNMVALDKDWLSEIIRCFSYPTVGAVSPKILRKDNTIRYAGAIAGGLDFSPIPFNGEFNELKEDFSEMIFCSREVSVLSASCLAIKSEIFELVGGFNEIETPDKFSNLDLSFKINEKGYSCIYCATSQLYSEGGNWYDNWFDQPSDTAYLYMLKRWIHKLTYDPYFTETMKKYYLNRIPIEYKISSNNKIDRSNYNRKQRNVLLVSHELSITGAPVALHYAAKALLNNGDYPVIISPFDGNLRQTIVDDGIPVIVDYSVFGDKIWINLAKNFDLVVVCTLVCNGLINHLEEAGIPTIWWAHEAKASYEIGALNETLPISLEDNIHLYCGGEYARKVLQSYRPSYKSNLLLYAVPDFSKNDSGIEYIIPGIKDKIVFSVIGSVMERKGQDILAKAIMEMPYKIIKQCKFIFIGKMVDAITYLKVKELKEKYPDEVILIDEVSRLELMEIYKICDCIICSSRDDPMPVFMTEAMMFSKVCICSENTGTAPLITDGINGFVYDNDDYTQLMQKLIYVFVHINELDDIKIRSRETYEQNFTMESFANKFISIIDSIISKEGI